MDWIITIQCRGVIPRSRRESEPSAGERLSAPSASRVYHRRPFFRRGHRGRCYRQCTATTATQQCRTYVNSILRVKHSKRIRQIGAGTCTYIIQEQRCQETCQTTRNVPRRRQEGPTLKPVSIVSVSRRMSRQSCCLSTGESVVSRYICCGELKQLQQQSVRDDESQTPKA